MLGKEFGRISKCTSIECQFLEIVCVFVQHLGHPMTCAVNIMHVIHFDRFYAASKTAELLTIDVLLLLFFAVNDEILGCIAFFEDNLRKPIKSIADVGQMQQSDVINMRENLH